MAKLVVVPLLICSCLLLMLTYIHGSLHVTKQQISRRLINVQVISRHCDRLPVSALTFSKNPIDWSKVSGLNGGDLTGLGQVQCSQLGDILQSRYIDSNSPTRIDGIDTKYNSKHYYFRSSDFDRTLMSMWSISMGMFKQGTGNRPIHNYLDQQDGGYSRFSLPNGTQAVPIHSVPQQEDVQLLGFALCNTVMNRLKKAMVSNEMNEFLSKNRGIIDKLYSETGWTRGDSSLETFFDILSTISYHNMLKSVWIKDNWDQVEKLKDDFYILGFNSQVIGKEGGSDLLQMIMAKFSAPFKYMHYSAHDTTIQTAAAALKLTDDYPFLGYQTPYGGYLVFELHEMIDNSQAVRIVFGNRYDDENVKPVTLTSLGCKDEYCPLTEFEKLVKQYSIVTDWCLACENTDKDVCYRTFEKKEVKILDTFELPFVIVVPILGSLTILFMVSTIVFCICFLKSRRTIKYGLERSTSFSKQLLP